MEERGGGRPFAQPTPHCLSLIYQFQSHLQSSIPSTDMTNQPSICMSLSPSPSLSISISTNWLFVCNEVNIKHHWSQSQLCSSHVCAIFIYAHPICFSCSGPSSGNPSTQQVTTSMLCPHLANVMSHLNNYFEIQDCRCWAVQPHSYMVYKAMRMQEAQEESIEVRPWLSSFLRCNLI